MLVPPIPLNEAKRIAALQMMCLLDTPPDEPLDALTELTCRLFKVPIVLVSLVDEDRQWFKSKVGLDVCETPRDHAFCAHAIAQSEPLIVPDAHQDPRFADNPLVVGEPHVRFYAGVQLTTAEGFSIGTLCIIDREPRTLTAEELSLLLQMGRLVRMRLERVLTGTYMDPLLRVPNNVRLAEDIAMHSASKAVFRPLALISVDLCGVGYFNEMFKALGPRYADEYLVLAKERLLECLPARTTVYRISVTRLAFFTNLTNEALAPMLDKLSECCAQTLSLHGIPHNASTVFSALRLDGSLDAAEVLRSLVSAADAVRESGKPWGFYDPGVDVQQKQSFQILSALSAALDAPDELALHYQPKVDLRTGQCLGVEALLRWNSPTLGFVPPATFIPLAEKTALIGRITQWVLNEALRQASSWHAQGLALSMAINVSAVDLDHPGFVEDVARLIRHHGVDASRIELEITEGALIKAPELLGEQLRRLRQLGVKVAIDDFGTGHSNFSYLKALSANTLKIDQTFIKDLLVNPSDWAIVPVLVQLAHKLKHRVVAEGIETAQVYGILAAWGCDEGQGYWIAKPMPAANLAQWLSEAAHRMPPRLIAAEEGRAAAHG